MDELERLRVENEMLRGFRSAQPPAPEKQVNVPVWLAGGMLALILPLGMVLVSATAFLAPIRDDVDRLGQELVQLEDETLTKEIRLGQRIDGVESQLERSNTEVSSKLAQIQADILVIKSRIDR
jgi:hypothetical protein